MELLPNDLPEFKPGWVWLAGAGPGDVGLLTLHALNALRQADVLVYDALVGEKIMELVSSNCELEYAGNEEENLHQSRRIFLYVLRNWHSRERGF